MLSGPNILASFSRYAVTIRVHRNTGYTDTLGALTEKQPHVFDVPGVLVAPSKRMMSSIREDYGHDVVEEYELYLTAEAAMRLGNREDGVGPDKIEIPGRPGLWEAQAKIPWPVGADIVRIVRRSV